MDDVSQPTPWLCLPPKPFDPNPITKKCGKPSLTCTRGTYTWSDNRHRCSHNQDLDIPDSALINSSCSVLSFFDGMYFCPVLQSIICPHHQCVVPLSEFVTHAKFHPLAKRRSGTALETLVEHIKHAYPMPPTSTTEEAYDLIVNLRLSSPISGLPNPELCIQCPNCQWWFVSRDQYPRKNIRIHLTKPESSCRKWYERQPRNFSLTSLPRYYANKLFKHSLLWNMKLAFDSNYQPAGASRASSPNEVPLPDNHNMVESPQYLIDLGWIPYIQDLHAVPSALLQLVALPSHRMSDLWPEESEGYNVEEGLTVLYHFFSLYLEDANTRMNSCHGSARDALVAGCVIFSLILDWYAN